MALWRRSLDRCINVLLRYFIIYGQPQLISSTSLVVVEITPVIQGSTSIKPEKSDRGILTLSLFRRLSLTLLPSTLLQNQLFLVPPSSSLLIDINFREFRNRDHFVSPTKLLEPLQSSLPHHFPYGPLFLQVHLFSSSSPFILCFSLPG